MWEFIADGKGRRAKILQVKTDTVEYNIGDVVEGEEFVGVILSFKRGDSEKSHATQLLLLLNDNKEVFATSKLKSVNLNEIARKFTIDLASVRSAVNHRRRNLNSVADLPENFDFTDPKAPQTIDSLFSKTQSPRKRRSPQKLAKSEANQSVESNQDEDSKQNEDASDESDEESELIPSRKRNQRQLTDALAAASIQSPVRQTSKTTNSQTFELKLELEHSNREHHNSDNDADNATDPDIENNQNYDPNLNDTDNNIGISPDQDKDEPPESILTPSSPSSVPLLSARRSRASTPQRAKSPQISILPKVQSTAGLSTINDAITQLHPASDPATHPCREEQFDQLFIALESAISAQTGTCIYVSGTPGTGKTSTIREVIGQLDLRVHEGELNPFTFLEINGMKLVHANAAYEHLWEALGRGQMAASNAMTALEAAFTANESIDSRGLMVVLLDELDQLVTKGQQLMYNFFNWPSLPNSRLIVIAVANTMDLPERVLSNKISSRVGLTRVQFPGYTFAELREIILQRLEDDRFQDLVEPEALEYAARKVAGVGGDARRALDFVRQAISSAEASNELPVKTVHVRDVIMRSQASPLATFVTTLGYATKIMLSAIVTRTRRTDNIEAPLHDILRLANQLVRSSSRADIFEKYLYSEDAPARLKTFQLAIAELVESGILVQQAIKGEATPFVRLMVPVSTIKEVLANDTMLQDMI